MGYTRCSAVAFDCPFAELQQKGLRRRHAAFDAVLSDRHLSAEHGLIGCFPMPSAWTTSRISAAALLKPRGHRWPAIADVGVLIILRRFLLRHFRVPRGQRSESGS